MYQMFKTSDDSAWISEKAPLVSIAATIAIRASSKQERSTCKFHSHESAYRYSKDEFHFQAQICFSYIETVKHDLLVKCGI